ncbi:MAG: phosphoribosylanthranilate isomerase [Rhodocyclaceae bacterium]|nr:phosphoribosylanthranilate isomerase [Rhodocyclaceae bacterium]MCE2980879.1 phosphoribosylanthranilate isomerase [Betaproteobacteria bacterium]MCA3074009.1 phosphoribosylanthranilate isomerase [Rhodocyclaceae bacterium]MCA3090691.1 phosphoribosylanthranilate isomerase [Rhodocyclaceae bacterium]MCA3094917.1 phosphoribosylanthranilate isomerase [Rhodocyclaceae bacterium]
MTRHRTRVKICGIRTVDDAQAAARAGTDAIGLVFYGPSPRHVTVQQAVRVVGSLPPYVMSVGLFVDAPAAEVREVLSAVPLDLLQFHGSEAPAFCAQFDKPFVQAVRVRPGVDLLQSAAASVPFRPLSRGLLVDAFVPGLHGGTGQSFDWSLIPGSMRGEVILSGGLTPANVRDAVRQVRPWAVDISSGVERSSGPKGVKDHGLIERFIEEVHLADV